MQETRTVAQPTLNIKQIEEVRVFLPPLALQQRFMEIVNRHEHTGKLNDEAVSASDDLFKSLVQRAFKGEL